MWSRNAGIADARKLLAVAHADDQRTLATGADEHVWVLGAHRDKRKVAAELADGRLHRCHEVVLVEVCDQVGDDLGVGLGAKLRAGRAQPVAQREVVLDDPVEHDVHAAVGVRGGGGRSPR